MQAIHITKGGGPEVLQFKTVELNKPDKREVRIQVKAAGVNRSDILTRQNPNAYGKDLPGATIPGLEVSGEVIEAGAEVNDLHVGDKVCALIPGGGYAEEVVVDERLCLPIPAGLNFIEAASLPEAIFTVWFNIFQQGKIKSEERLLIHGGTSGVGIMGLQMAAAMGIKTYTTVGSQEKVDFIKQHKLGSVINYKEEDFERAYKDEQIDVILDMVGGSYTNKNLSILNKNGRLLYINGMNGTTPEINLWTIMSKNLILTGSLLKPQSVEVKAQIASEVHKYVWPLLEQKKVKPVIYKTFSLAEAAEAHKLMESSTHIGKIVLSVD